MVVLARLAPSSRPDPDPPPFTALADPFDVASSPDPPDPPDPPDSFSLLRRPSSLVATVPPPRLVFGAAESVVVSPGARLSTVASGCRHLLTGPDTFSDKFRRTFSTTAICRRRYSSPFGICLLSPQAIHLARELDCSDGIKPPPPDAQRPSPNADSRSIKFFKFVDSSALSSSSIIFRVTVKVKVIPVSDLSTGLRFSLGFSESYGYRYGNIGVLPLSLTSAPIPPLSISFNYLNRSLFLLWNEDVVLSLMLFLPQFEDVAGSVGFFMKLYLPQYEDITLWCTSFLPKYEVIWTFAFVVLVSIISSLLSWQWWSSSQLSVFIKHGFVVSVFVAVRSPAVHVKILSTDLVNVMWFKAFKIGGFGWSIYGKGEARDSQGSSISLSAGSSLANEAGKMIEALQSAKTRRLSSLQLILDSIVLSSAIRSWLDMIKITGLLFRNLVTLFTPLSCTFNQCAATCFAVAFTMSVVSKLCSLIIQF